jgi:iron complex transport system substrate-binding protein
VKEIDAISGHVIDVALRIHKELGPGLLETVHEIVLAHKPGHIEGRDQAGRE